MGRFQHMLYFVCHKTVVRRFPQSKTQTLIHTLPFTNLFLDPISFELSCKSAEEAFAAIPLQFHVDCSQVDLQLRVNPLFKYPKEKSLPFEIHYKTFDSGGNTVDPIPTNEKRDAIPA